MYEDLECPACGYGWSEIAMVGTRGMVCPDCLYEDREFLWAGSPGEQTDGCWLQPVGWERATLFVFN